MQKNEMAQRLSQLKEREQKTRDQEIRIRAQEETVLAELEKAKKAAIEAFGTDDLTILRETYKKAKEEDARAMQGYEQDVIIREQLIDTIMSNVESLRLN